MIPSTEDTMQAITDWAVATLPELSGSYAYATDERTEGLPDIAIEITDYTIGQTTVTGALAQIQQIEQSRLKTSNVELIVVVGPDPAETADATLKEFSDRLVTSILKDKTLGGRVMWASDSPRVAFRPPYVQFDDGTRGRIVTLYMQIGQQVEA